MVFAEPAQSRPDGSLDEPASVLFPFVSQTVSKYAKTGLEEILTKAMNDWIGATFFDGGQDAKEELKAVGRL